METFLFNMIWPHLFVATVPQEAWLIAATGYIVVFTALLLIYVVFTNLPKAIGFFVRRNLRKAGRTQEASQKDISVVGEVNAAIAASIYHYFNELHDEEMAVITIKKVNKRYSPWSSKLYNMNPYYRNRKS